METWSQSLDLRALADRFGTPLYIHNVDHLRRTFERWVRLVGEPGNVRYPVKANPSPTVLGTLAGLGSGADCASAAEVRDALGHGIPMSRVSYNTPAFDPRLAAWVLAAGGTVVADSPEVLRRLEEGHGDEGGETAGEVFLRVNPGGLPGYRTPSDIQRYTAHGGETSQFGIPSEEVLELARETTLAISGLHVHVGTQMDNVDTFVSGLGFLHRLVDLLHAETRHRIATVNLGGGLGIPYLAGQEFPSVDELVDALRPHLRPELTYQVEPGNALVGEAVALLARVAGTKTTRGKRWAIADVGTDQLVKHTVARWEHQIVGPDHRPLPQEGPDGLAGPLCFAGDVLYPETDLGDIETGDPLLVQHAGAYTEAVASRFNGRPAPAHVAIETDGEIRQVRRTEDTFFAPAVQTYRAPALEASTDRALLLDPARVQALESSYMHELAADDRYEIREARSLGGGAYEFVFDLDARVDFVAMPFAVRLVGDAAIIAVGHEMGWQEKPGPVWATRLSMTCERVVPVEGPLVCRIVVGALAPSTNPGLDAVAVAHYRLGESLRGVAHVAVPAGGDRN